MTATEYPPVQTPPTAKKNGAALASLILGIVSVVANVLFIPTLLGLVFGIIGLTRASRLGRKGMAIGGIVLSIVGAIVGAALLVFIIVLIGRAAETAAATGPVVQPSVSVGSDDGASAPADDDPPADLPAGYKAVSDDVWFKWGKTKEGDFLVQKTATVIVPNGCDNLLVEANEYDKSGTNIGSTGATASNLGAGDKAKLKFSWLPDDGVDSVKLNEATCF